MERPGPPEIVNVCRELGILKCTVSQQAEVRATVDSSSIQEGLTADSYEE